MKKEPTPSFICKSSSRYRRTFLNRLQILREIQNHLKFSVGPAVAGGWRRVFNVPLVNLRNSAVTN